MEIKPEQFSKAVEMAWERIQTRNDVDPSLIREPEILGLVEIPQDVRGVNSIFGIKVVNMLEPGRAVKIRIDNAAQRRVYQKRILKVASNHFGTGKIRTASDDDFLYVWLKEGEYADLNLPESKLHGLFIQNQ